MRRVTSCRSPLRVRHLVAAESRAADGRFADAAVVGSGLVNLAEAGQGPDLTEKVESYVRCTDGGGLMTIDELRLRSDRLDERLVELLSERAHCALGIGKLRSASSATAQSRGAGVRVARQAHGSPLEGDAIVRVFERIIDEARRIERATAHSKVEGVDRPW